MHARIAPVWRDRGRLLTAMALTALSANACHAPRKADQRGGAPPSLAVSEHQHAPHHAEAHDAAAYGPLFLHAAGAISDACVCNLAQVRNGWCGKCQVGYLAGVAIRSAMLFDALDPHGHDINPATITCKSCQVALRSDGFCERCRLGFVNQKLYFTRLTYLLARGRPIKPDHLACAACAVNAGSRGWCEACRMGLVGHFEYRDKSLFEQSAAEYDRLLAAVQTLSRCEFCAVVIFTGGDCPACGKRGSIPTGECRSDKP